MKKRILAILAAVMLSALSVFYPYAEAKASGLPELIYTALPLTWPLVTKIFQALGIGTAEYFNSLPLVDRESLITGFRGAGAQAALEIWSKIGAKSANDNLDDYIPAVIDDGVLRISQSILDVASQFAKENGMLSNGAGGSDATGYISTPLSVGDTLNDYVVSNTSFMDNMNIPYLEGVKSAVSGILATSPNAYIALCFTTSSQGIINNTVYIDYTEDSRVVSSVSTVGNGYIYSCSSSRGKQIVVSNGEITYTNNNFNNVPYVQNINDNYILANGALCYSNLNRETTSIDNDVPVGEKGQTAEQDGAWSLPYDDGSAKPIDNFGDTYPLSIPDYIGQDLLRWRETAQDIDLGLADLADDLDITRPVEGTQTKAQEGTVDEPYEIDVDSPLIPSVPALTVPNFIKERFPFCIPFDLVRMVKRFTSNDTTAPVFDMERPFFGTTIHLHIDFSMFDDLARLVRIGVLALTAIGIMKVTVDVIKW